MSKYTEEEINLFLQREDAQINDNGSITWSIDNTQGRKPGTFLQRPPGAAPLITEDTAADLVAKKWEPYENMEAFERWRFRQKFIPWGPEKDTGKGGYVYFIRATEEPFYIKIGRASDPFKRISGIQSASPVKLNPLVFVQVPHMKQFEKLFHEYFAPKRIRGEWFDIRPKDVYELLNKFWKETNID